MTPPTIRLLHPGATQIFSVDQVYFPFESGRFSYDCVTCGAKCCRGYGYMGTPGEIERQLAQRPDLRFFVAMDRGQGTPVGNCPPACFFLTRDNLCAIHRDEGPDAKPETCRYFPFNHIRRVGPYLVVAPHVNLCPLRVEPLGSVSANSSHHSLFDAMAAHGVGVNATAAKPIVPGLDHLIALERRIVDLSSAHHGRDHYPTLAAAMLDTTREGGLGTFTATPADLPGKARVDRFLAVAADLFGISPNDLRLGDQTLDDAMGACTPFLRSQWVFLDAGSTSRRLEPDYSLDQVPLALLGVYLMAVLARRAGLPTVTFQTLSHLSRQSALPFLLVHADTVMVWKPGLMIELPVSPRIGFDQAYLKVVKSLLGQSQRRNPQTLATIIGRENQWQGVDRALFLSLVGERLVGKVRPLDEPATSRPNVMARVRSGAQRFALAHLDESLLLATSRRIAAVDGEPEGPSQVA